ncbi:MAG: o-succinylbenzoate synthase [Calditrichaeota bacterium]|nr:o-succinylbenzoate synthase [Calditrichota bacterium]
MKGSAQDHRDGLIVEIIDRNGLTGLGDAAPFPGLHKESLQDIIDEFKNIYPIFSELDSQSGSDIWQILNSLPECSPSLRFALDWAFVELKSAKTKLSPVTILGSDNISEVFINGLLTGSPAEIVESAKKLFSKNYQSIKVKVATHAIEEEINLIKELNELFGGKISLRLDANQSWKFDEAVKFGKAVKSTNIEYLEEPCSNPELFENFYRETKIPYAFDESLLQNTVNQMKNFDGLKTLILKPAVLGYLSKTRDWVNWAANQNKGIVFSSTFESGVGLRAICNLAAAYGTNGLAHGLDTFNWLKEDITIPAFSAINNSIDLSNQSFQLKRNKLKKIHEHAF